MTTLDQIVRIAVIVLIVSFAVLRIVLYFRGGMARRSTMRATTTTPFTMPPSLPPPPEQALSQTSTSQTAEGPASAMGKLVTVLVAVGLNLGLWFALFVPQFMNNIPVVWRLFIGIFANFYLLPFARRVGRRSEH